MNLFENILKKSAPKIPDTRNQFLSGFQKPQQVISKPENKFSFIPKASA
jgi:hypothetical protein